MYTITKEQITAYISEKVSSEVANKLSKFAEIDIQQKRKVSAALFANNWICKDIVQIAAKFIDKFFNPQAEDENEGLASVESKVEKRGKRTMMKATEEDIKIDATPNRRRGTTSFISFTVRGFNIESSLNSFELERDKLDEFPDVPKASANHHEVLLKRALGTSYNAYIRQFEDYRRVLRNFLSESDKKIITSPKIFTISRSKDKTVVEYKTWKEDGLRDKRGKKKTETHELPSDSDMYKALIAFTEYCKSIKPNTKITREESLQLIKSDLINTLEAFDVSVWSNVEEYCKERSHSHFKVLGDEDVEISDAIDNLRGFVAKRNSSPKLTTNYKTIIGLTQGLRISSFQSRCLSIFRGREAICECEKLTPKMKEETWLTALANINQISNPDEFQLVWKHILSSQIMYLIFMYGLKEALWMKPGLEWLVKHKQTMRLALRELYPISFVFTPYMFGYDGVKPYFNSDKRRQLGYTLTDYFNTLTSDDNPEIQQFSNSAWIYYCDKDGIRNETLSLLQPIVDEYITFPTERKKVGDGDDDGDDDDKDDDKDDDGDDDNEEEKPVSKSKTVSKSKAVSPVDDDRKSVRSVKSVSSTKSSVSVKSTKGAVSAKNMKKVIDEDSDDDSDGDLKQKKVAKPKAKSKRTAAKKSVNSRATKNGKISQKKHDLSDESSIDANGLLDDDDDDDKREESEESD